VVRARVSDGGGAATDDDSATFIGLTGADEIPYSYPNTQIKAIPASASIPAGSTAVIKAVNQSGAAIPGALVSSGVSSGTLIASTPDLTDADGNVVVTGSAAGTANLVLSVMNLAGATISTTVPLTITGTSTSTVTVTPANVSMFVNQAQQFTSVIAGGGTTVWSVVLGGGSISSTGLYTAPATATTAVIRGAKQGELSTYDESIVTVSAATQSGIGAVFLGDGDLSVAPGQSFSWQVKVLVNGQAFEGATIVPSSLPVDILDITTPLATSAAGTTTVTGSVVADTDTDIEVEVTLDITAGSLTMPLRATVTVQDSPYGYVIVRGRRYPRRFEQK